MAQIHARYVQQNLVYWQGHRKRIIDAFGQDVIKYDLQPGLVSANAATASPPAGWAETVVEVGAGTTEFVGSVNAGSIATITTAANENDGGNWQLSGESWELTSGQPLCYLGASFAINDVDQTDFAFGLSITDSDILGGVTDAIYFEKSDAAATVTFVVEKDSTETTSGTVATMVDATQMIFELYWDGSALEAFVDGASVSTPALTNLPDNEALKPTINFLTGEAVANTLDIQWLRAFQIGR